MAFAPNPSHCRAIDVTNQGASLEHLDDARNLLKDYDSNLNMSRGTARLFLVGVRSAPRVPVGIEKLG